MKLLIIALLISITFIIFIISKLEVTNKEKEYYKKQLEQQSKNKLNIVYNNNFIDEDKVQKEAKKWNNGIIYLRIDPKKDDIKTMRYLLKTIYDKIDNKD